MRSRLDLPHNNLLEWIIEESNDRVKWFLIHYKPRGNEIKESGTSYNHICSGTRWFRMFRIMHISENYHIINTQKFDFAFNKIEFFGKIGSNDRVSCIIRRRSDFYKHLNASYLT